MLNFLSRTARPDTVMAVHRCARFSENPRLSHEKEIKIIAKQPIGTKHIGIHAKIDSNLGLTAHDDYDFASG